MSYRLLTAPNPSEKVAAQFVLLAASSQAEKGWKELSRNHEEAAQRCYQHLVTDPFRRIPGRVFPLRGRQFQGVWEFEVTGSERLYYRPDSVSKTVLVLQAGGHRPPPE